MLMNLLKERISKGRGDKSNLRFCAMLFYKIHIYENSFIFKDDVFTRNIGVEIILVILVCFEDFLKEILFLFE